MFAQPKKAATIALVRNGISGPEVLLMKRGASDRFLPSYNVFPGGGLDSQDALVRHPGLNLYEKLVSPEARNNLLMHLAASVRETFEESGILLAYDKTGRLPETDNPGKQAVFNEYRHMVLKRELSFNDFLIKEDLVPAYDMLHYHSRWITPFFSPIRYDARFFVAECPSNQHVSHDGEELVETVWIRPSEAIKKYRSGGMRMVAPTLSTLEFLRDFNSVDDIRESFINKELLTPLTEF